MPIYINIKIKKITMMSKLKKKLIIILIIFLLTGCFSSQNKDNVKSETTHSSADLINTIINYNIDNDNINVDFLNWIYDQYGLELLTKVNNYLESNNYSDNIWHELTGNSLIVLQDYYNRVYDTMDNVKFINTKTKEVSLGFVGDVSLADNFDIMPKYDERKNGIYGILSNDVVEIMNNMDIMVANNEFTISNRGTPIPNKVYTFRANPDRVKIYDEMGIDLVTLANNHVYDFGEDAFIDTLNTLKENNISYIGAGMDISEASKPYFYVANGYKIAFVNATRAEKYILTPEATDKSSGVLRAYDPTKFKEIISMAKKQSDFVIALIHWGREDSHELEEVQITTGKEYIDSGADVIIGTHAHTLQGIEFYNNKAIIYNIGDFIFNRESKDTGILKIIIDDKGNLIHYFIPCHQQNMKTTLLKSEDSIKVLNNLRSWSTNTIFDNDGKFYQLMSN